MVINIPKKLIILKRRPSFFDKLIEWIAYSNNDPGPLNITFGSDMSITLLHLIYLVNSEMKNVIGMSDPNVMFKGLGPMILLFC